MGIVHCLVMCLSLPACFSLKEKRSEIKPILSRLHREFNISAAEIEKQDVWHEAVIACVVISNDAKHNQQLLQTVMDFTADHWRNLPILEYSIQSL